MVHAGPYHPGETYHAKDHEKRISISNVRGVDISIACELYIRQGDKESLKIVADKDIFDELDVKVRDSILYIDSDARQHVFDDWDVEVYLTVKALNQIDIGGAVKLRTSGKLITGKLELSVSGAADIRLHIETEKLLVDLSGAVNAELKGEAKYVVMDMSGASNIEADDLITDALYLDFSGFGKAEVYAGKVLKVDMSGMGIVHYKGDPGKVDTRTSGLGIIKSR